MIGFPAAKIGSHSLRDLGDFSFSCGKWVLPTCDAVLSGVWLGSLLSCKFQHPTVAATFANRQIGNFSVVWRDNTDNILITESNNNTK